MSKALLNWRAKGELILNRICTMSRAGQVSLGACRPLVVRFIEEEVGPIGGPDHKKAVMVTSLGCSTDSDITVARAQATPHGHWRGLRDACERCALRMGSA